jgi:hypothetical protein
MDERYKITVKDRKTGDKTTFYVSDLGMHVSWNPKIYPVGPTMVDQPPSCVKLVLDYPRIKRKEKCPNSTT